MEVCHVGSPWVPGLTDFQYVNASNSPAAATSFSQPFEIPKAVKVHESSDDDDDSRAPLDATSCRKRDYIGETSVLDHRGASIYMCAECVGKEKYSLARTSK